MRDCGRHDEGRRSAPPVHCRRPSDGRAVADEPGYRAHRWRHRARESVRRSASTSGVDSCRADLPRGGDLRARFQPSAGEIQRREFRRGRLTTGTPVLDRIAQSPAIPRRSLLRAGPRSARHRRQRQSTSIFWRPPADSGSAFTSVRADWPPDGDRLSQLCARARVERARGDTRWTRRRRCMPRSTGQTTSKRWPSRDRPRRPRGRRRDRVGNLQTASVRQVTTHNSRRSHLARRLGNVRAQRRRHFGRGLSRLDGRRPVILRVESSSAAALSRRCTAPPRVAPRRQAAGKARCEVVVPPQLPALQLSRRARASCDPTTRGAPI